MSWTKHRMRKDDWEAKKQDVGGILAAVALAPNGPHPVIYKELTYLNSVRSRA